MVGGARCVSQEDEVLDSQKPEVTSGMTRAEQRVPYLSVEDISVQSREVP